MIHPENNCNGKIIYKTFELANEAVKNRNKDGGKRVSSYRCKVCGFIHFGHQSKGTLQKTKASKRVEIDWVGGVHIVDIKNIKGL